MRRLVLLVAAAACGPVAEETRIDELRVVATIPTGAAGDSPDVGPGESYGLSVWVVEPSGAPVDVAVWSCTALGPPGTPCAEAQDPVGQWIAVSGEADSLRPWRTRLTAWDEAPVPPGGTLESTLWTLACPQGACPVIERLRAADPGEADPSLGELLADPSLLLQDLPLAGISLASRPLPLVDRPVSERNAHPRLSVVVGPAPPPEEGMDLPEGRLALDVTYRDDATVLPPPGPVVYGFATAGGFDVIATAVLPEPGETDGVGNLIWVPPEDDPTAEADVFLVGADGAGGEAVWSGRIGGR